MENEIIRYLIDSSKCLLIILLLDLAFNRTIKKFIAKIEEKEYHPSLNFFEKILMITGISMIPIFRWIYVVGLAVCYLIIFIPDKDSYL